MHKPDKDKLSRSPAKSVSPARSKRQNKKQVNIIDPKDNKDKTE